MKTINQDMLAIESGVLFHQVNCRGVMGGGIAYSMAQKFPGLEKGYKELCKKYDFNQVQMLGKVWVFSVNNDLKIANVFGQGDISRTTRMTSYDATVEAFERVKRSMEKSSFFKGDLYFPHGMGCGLGGGDWRIYSAIIESFFPDATICKYEL